MIITKHAKQRYRERIHENSSDLLVELVAKEAYENGKMPIQLYDTDPDLFKYLQVLQDKYHNNIVRLLQDAIFIFKKEQDIKLITCYKADKNSYKKYLQKKKFVI